MLTESADESLAIMLTISGRPRPQPRPRFVGGRAVSTADRKAQHWRSLVERAARQVMADMGPGGLPAWLGGPVRLQATFMFETGKRKLWGAPHAARPDTDNLAKPVMDVLERVGMLPKGDARVVQLEACKMWSKGNGAVVILGPLPQRAPAALPESAPAWLTPVTKPRNSPPAAEQSSRAQLADSQA